MYNVYVLSMSIYFCDYANKIDILRCCRNVKIKYEITNKFIRQLAAKP